MHVDGGCLDPDDVAALLHARLPPASLRVMEQHVAVCSECRKLLSALAQTEVPPVPGISGTASEPASESCNTPELAATVPPGEPQLAVVPGAHVGRYVVASQLGAGAMGVVYAAYDPELDRKVALKILRHDGFARRDRELVRDHLRREAQAMAQLAHPNVVTVYDVGTVDDHIFIAMELVEGDTLAAWLAAAPRSWRAVVAKFLAAGQGLAAAHSAGMIHRDFKPENVLVGRDGRVRVGDFGLARMLASEASSSSGEPPGSETARDSVSITASFAGTPYYMAPEQLLGRATDARSDQFSFCVALYAAIARQHPFAGHDAEGLVEAIIEGRRRPSHRSAMPRRLLRILRRGLATAPADRYPSMEALLAELADAPGLPRARAWIVAAAAVVLAVGGALLARSGEPQLLCKGAEQKWTGIWDPSRAKAVEQAFFATGKPYASAAYAAVARALGTYRAGWTAMHTDACEATRVRGEQAEDLMGRRMLCLDARLRDARALIDRFAAADAAIVERAPVAVGSLGDLASCADVQALSSQVPPPADKVTGARVAALRAELAELKAQRVAGHTRDGRDRVAALVAAAAGTRYRPLEAEALLEQGIIESAAGDWAVAERAYEQAVWAAEAGRADELAARAWTGLMQVRRSQARYDEALALAPRVTATLERLGGNDELEGGLHIATAAILTAADRHQEAQAAADKARVVLERRFGPDDLHVADALEGLAEIAHALDRIDDALAYYRRALAIKQKVLGDNHPAVAAVLYSLSHEESMKSRYQDALVTLDKARTIYERAVDANHPALGNVAHSFGLIYEALGQFDKAVAMYRRAVAIGAIAYGKDHPSYGAFLMNLGDALEGLARHDEALTTLNEALAILESRLGPEHTRVALCLEYIARVLFAQARFREARAMVARSIAVSEKIYGRQSSNLRQALLLLGNIELKLGAMARALVPLERAYAFGSDTDPGVYAEIQWALGRALVESHRDAARGMSLVRDAQREFEHDERTADDLRELTEWRRRHP